MQCYEANADAVFRHCWFRVRDRERAQDIMQEAFCRTWTAIAGGSRIDNVRAYVFTTATHLIIDHARRKKEQSLDALLDAGWQTGVDARPHLEANADARRALTALAALTDEEREILVLRYVEAFPPREIAAMYGTTVNAMTVRIHRTKTKARRALRAAPPL